MSRIGAMSDQLSNTEILRYSRQLILPEWGVKGQVALKSSAVLVVGVGGLGCPASLYLAAAGVGLLGLLDYDAVELNNLHRQILHIEQNEGQAKVISGQMSISRMNSLVKCRIHHILLNHENAMDIISSYDVVLDCTDNVATRYLLNDACVLLGKPLISGSALRFEGQLTVYNYQEGPCYRCLFPIPPPPNTVTNCSEGGVMGPVPGVIGTMQALEVMKIMSGAGTVLSGKMYIFDGLAGCSRTVTLRARQLDCIVCGDSPTLPTLIDYQAFCGTCATDKVQELSLLASEHRVTCQDYHAVVLAGKPHNLMDVRPRVEFEICHLDNAIKYDIPIQVLQSESIAIPYLKDVKLEESVYIICHRGNDSQLAVPLLKKMLPQNCKLQDIIGGLNAWSDDVDQTFPKY